MKNGRKGGIRSGEVRRERKALRDVFFDLLTAEVEPGVTAQEKMCSTVLHRAMDGDMRACEFIRDAMEGKPVKATETKSDTERAVDALLDETLFGGLL